MKEREINEGRNGTIWVPNSIADWDAPSHWERERLGSMQEHLKHGMVLVDVGTEHGWLTAVYGQFVGPENVVLCEPGDEMWQDIRLTWEWNKFPPPLGIWHGFVGAKNAGLAEGVASTWPSWTSKNGAESPPMAYRNLRHHAGEVPTITLDAIGADVHRIDAITIDVEGAELLVMQGATETLEMDRPLVWISVHPDMMERDFGHNADDLFDLMTAAGYRNTHLGRDHEDHYFFAPDEYIEANG